MVFKSVHSLFTRMKGKITTLSGNLVNMKRKVNLSFSSCFQSGAERWKELFYVIKLASRRTRIHTFGTSCLCEQQFQRKSMKSLKQRAKK